MISLFGLVVFTVVEVVGLVAWLALVRSGRQVLGVLVLPVAFFIEHLIAFNVKRGVGLLRLDVPAGRIAVNAVIETVVWVAWLALWMLGGVWRVVATVVLFVTLVIEHSITDNIFRGRPLFDNLLNRNTLGFSAVETIGATGWIVLVDAGQGLVGVAVLAIASLIEHRMALSVASRPSPLKATSPTQPSARAWGSGARRAARARATPPTS